MPDASCSNCGARLTKRSRFCPECGVRVGARSAETAVQEIPPEETGPVPVELTTAAPRFFGVTPPAAALALAAASLALAVLLLATGHAIVGGVLLAVALLLGLLCGSLARRLPDTPAARLSLDAVSAIRAHAGFAVEALTVHSSARMGLFKLRRELAELLAQRTECARALGEAVYADDTEASDSARSRMTELDGLIAAKEEEMEQTAAGAMERIQRAQLQVQPTMVETPEPPGPPSPEPYPPPTEPPVPVPIPEPTPEPSEPPGPVRVPEPGPEPSPPANPQG
jgi:zinc ribbon protein